MMLFLPFALTHASAYALYPLMGLYLVLTVYTVLGGWTRKGQRQQTRLWQMLVLPMVTFVALWLCGRLIWELILWLWIGEAYVPHGPLTAATLAAVSAGILLVRLATGWVTSRYLRYSVWGTGVCVGLLGTIYAIEFVDPIDGWTARGAAEKKFAYLMKPSEFYPGHLPRRIVDETTAALSAHGGKAFTLYIGENPAAELRVMPYYRLWWTQSYFRTTPFAGQNLSTEEKIQKLRESLKK